MPSLKRRPAQRLPKALFVIICEGKNTEPDYFRAIADKFVKVLVSVEIIGAAGVPLSVANRACQRALDFNRRRRKESFELRDQVWAVFDRDEHPAYEDAVRKCKDNGVGVARSNPCFEVWMILHFEEYDRAGGRKDAQKRLEEVCTGYSQKKGKTTGCGKLVDVVEVAEARAEKQLEARNQEGSPFGAPSTTVFNLTRAMRNSQKLGS